MTNSVMKVEMERNKYRDEAKQLRQWLGVVLDCVDYTSGACGLTEMVGAVLPKEVIEKAKEALKY